MMSAMKNEDEAQAGQEADGIAEYLRHWPGLYMRQGDKIVEALPEDVVVAKTYPTAKVKGRAVGGIRLTILTKKTCYRVNEEVRVIHVMEVIEPGHKMFVMGPKQVYGEYVDGKLVTPEAHPQQVYDGLVLDSPNVDYNYDITTYSFDTPGRHEIYWQVGEVRSNKLELDVVES